MSLLAVQSVHRCFGGLQAVKDVSFSVERGQIKAVIGPNGAGKTTLFNLISGSLGVDTGRILFNGIPIQSRRPHQIAALGLRRTFQNVKLFHGMTVLENVMLGCHTRARAGFLAGLCAAPWTWDEERRVRTEALAALEFLRLTGYAGLEAGRLAFGQQRQVELARALAGRPALLLLDEPAAGLNRHETDELAGTLRRIRDRDSTVVLVEHDMSLVMGISDEIVVLNSGVKIAEGPPAAIQRNAEVVRIYLGEEETADC